MRRAIVLALLFVVGLVSGAAAQSPPVTVGDNANIIPIYKTSDPPAYDDYLRGNLLGQRCNEPSIAVFENNPQTMMVFCNDYRATFNFDDLMVPAGKTTLLARAFEATRTFFARLIGRPGREPGEEKKKEEYEASSDAAIGGGISYDGGVTWQGFMVPGGPNDDSPASASHPGKLNGIQGYADPWVVKLSKDTIGVLYIGFTRDKATGQATKSGVFFSRYQNVNNSDTVHTVRYLGTSTVVLDNNMTEGQFNDKVGGTLGADGVVYATFSRFTGSKGSTNIYIYRSVDGGVNWLSDSAIDSSAKYGQASVALANPDPAKASVVGVLWRTFGTTPTLIYRRYGKGTKSVDLFTSLTASDLGGPYRPFDQFSQPINGDPNRVAFRSLAFPAATYTRDGTKLLVFFTEWIDLATGRPPTSTSTSVLPMMVMKYSTNDGLTWSPRIVLNWQNNEKTSVPGSPDKLGFFSPARAVGAQFMPAVGCNATGQCLVLWKQDYGKLGMNPGGTENSGKFVLSGLGRRFDVRGALVSFGTNGPVVSGSFQASRYGYQEPKVASATGETIQVSDSELLSDGSPKWAEKMALPNGQMYPLWDWGNRNHTAQGGQAFIGDYMSVVAKPDDPSTFFVAFADNRYNIWPWQTAKGGIVPMGQEWAYYPVYMAPDDPENAVPGISCVNYGSRVQSVMVAKVSTRHLLLTAQTNHKDFDSANVVCGGSFVNGTWTPNQACIEFPVTVRNNTPTKQKVALDVVTGSASFVKRPYRPDLGEPPYAYPLTTGSVEIFPYSSYSFNVYAFDDNELEVEAEIQVCDAAGANCSTLPDSTVTLVLNDPAVAQASGGADFAYVPSTVNLQSGGLRSGGLRSGGLRSGGLRSGTPVSYPVPEDPVPGTTVYDVIDATYTVTPASQDDAGTYLSLFNIDPAYEGNYVFQVFVTKPLTSFQNDKDTCSAYNFREGALVGHISDPTNPLVSGGLRSGGLRSGGLRSGGLRSAIPSEGDSLVQNTSFTLGSSTDLNQQTGGVSAMSATEAVTSLPGCRIDECSKAAPRLPNEVTILVRAYQIKPTSQIPVDLQYDPDGTRTGTPTPPGVAVAEYSCDGPDCTFALGPDLVVEASAPPVAPGTRVPAGGTLTFADTLATTNRGEDGQCGTAEDPFPCALAHEHQWAVYASSESDFANVPKYDCRVDACPAGTISGTVKLNSDPTKGAVTVLLASDAHGQLACEPISATDPTCDGATEDASVGTVTIPSSIPRTNADGTGTYYLHYYDDSRRVVNELVETNNTWSSGAITVLAPGYSFGGLQTPCSGYLCDKGGAIVIAWQFLSGGVPVDSYSTFPRLKFYRGQVVPGSSPVSCPVEVTSSTVPTLTTYPTAETITSGSSGWQYYPDPGMTRPQYTWQLNFWQTGLPAGCYTMWMEIPDTGQVLGSTDPLRQPIGPFTINQR